MITDKCTEACAVMPDCLVCGMRKPPNGRSIPTATVDSYCSYECPGRNQEPKAGHLWPAEWREYLQEQAVLKDA